MRCFVTFFVCSTLCYALSVSATASTSLPSGDAIEGADSIESTIEQRDALIYDPTRRSLFPDFYNVFRTWREDMNQKIRLEAIFSYDMLAQGYVDTDVNQGASSGDLSLTGRWLLFGYKYQKPVYLSFRIRHRHAYGQFAPSQLSSSTGLLWKTVDGFTDAGFQIPDFNISQELAEGRLTLRYGQFGIDNFFDNHNLRSAKRYFLNQIFSANPSVAFPSYGAGFTAQWKDTENWDLSVGGSNIQGRSEDEEINLNLDSSALFYTAQGGLNFTGWANRSARIQLLAWSSHNNNEKDLPDGSGASLTLEHQGTSSTDYFVARLGLSEGGASHVDRMIMVGWGREVRKYDHFGLGFGTGRSAVDERTWQGVAETYYRWQVTKELLITPDLQIIVGQGHSGSDTLQIVAGVRGGFNF